MSEKDRQRYLDDMEMQYMCKSDSSGLGLAVIGIFMTVLFSFIAGVVK
jgi:hypothetical protein